MRTEKNLCKRCGRMRGGRSAPRRYPPLGVLGTRVQGDEFGEGFLGYSEFLSRGSIVC